MRLWLAGCCLLLAPQIFAELPKPAFPLFDPGQPNPIDYEKFGQFREEGTPRYLYVISDREGLARAAGEGIYPNVTGLLKDPDFQKYRFQRKLEGSHWNFVHVEDLRASFFKWAIAQENPGAKQFYVADALERAGHIAHAIKAYCACAVHFPKATGATYWKTPWYIGPTAIDRIHVLTRKYPELGLRLEGARIRIQNRFDDQTRNDSFLISPGRLMKCRPDQVVEPRMDVNHLNIGRSLGAGAVRLVQRTNGHWQLLVNDQPMTIKAVSYTPSKIGLSPDNGTLVPNRDWMLADENKNGKIDGPYDAWVDANRNDRQDPDEKTVGDFALLKAMGANTLRLYHHAYHKALLRDAYNTYGLRVILGDFLGAYAIGSGADWYAGTDYTNPQQQEKMLVSVRQMVEEYKNEPYVLLWVLGNENNYGNANNSRQKPEAYYQFANRAAKLIKSLDPNHPVGLSNGDLLFLDKVKRWCPDVDIYGSNAYRGKHGFGDTFWTDLVEEWGKPVLITELGCPAYHRSKSAREAEALQAEYLKGNWQDIEYNTAGSGAGNAIGGVLFEWLDEWWKAGPPPEYDPAAHDTTGQFGGPFPDGWSYEEWYGLASQGHGRHSPFLRQLRPAYFLFRDQLWNPK